MTVAVELILTNISSYGFLYRFDKSRPVHNGVTLIKPPNTSVQELLPLVLPDQVAIEILFIICDWRSCCLCVNLALFITQCQCCYIPLIKVLDFKSDDDENKSVMWLVSFHPLEKLQPDFYFTSFYTAKLVCFFLRITNKFAVVWSRSYFWLTCEWIEMMKINTLLYSKRSLVCVLIWHVLHYISGAWDWRVSVVFQEPVLDPCSAAWSLVLQGIPAWKHSCSHTPF